LSRQDEVMNKLSFVKNYKSILLILFAGLAYLLTTIQPSFLDKFALGFEDGKFAVRTGLGLTPKPDERVVIVTVDERSVNQLGRWPWRRDIIGDMLFNLREAGVVALDIVFSEETEAKYDDYLSDKILETGNIVPGFFLRDDATEETTEDNLYLLEDCSYLNFETTGDTVGVKEFPFAEVNIEQVADAGLTCAYFNTEADIDGLYRRYPIAYIHKGYVFPPIGIQSLRYYLNQDTKLVLGQKGVEEFEFGDIEINNKSYFKLNYYDDIKYISAHDVYTGAIKPEYFKDKVVIVGVTETGIYDMRPTPLSPVTPGVSLHYTAISNILQGSLIKWNKTWDFFFVLFAILGVFSLSFLRKQWIRWTLYTVFLFSVLAISYGLFIYTNIWFREFYALLPAIGFLISLEAVAFFKTDIHAREIKKAFGSYLSPELVDEIMSNPGGLELGGQERELTILFSDIRGFTTLSETLTPTELVSMLNRLLDPMTNVILKNRGMLDKYIGDALMALFNTPVDVPDHPDKAVISALELLETLKELNEKFKSEGIPTVDVGIGINTGNVVVGNMGSKVRFEYTAIGDSVNLASRLEGLCKVYKIKIIISIFTKERLTINTPCRMLDKVRVKGKYEPVLIFEPMVDTEQNKLLIIGFENALDKYFSMNFSEALVAFSSISEQFGDETSKVFAERCEQFIKHPPEQNWDGVYTLETK
jgi:adenylate cyclase